MPFARCSFLLFLFLIYINPVNSQDRNSINSNNKSSQNKKPINKTKIKSNKIAKESEEEEDEFEEKEMLEEKLEKPEVRNDLPFAVTEDKHLETDDLNQKKEGGYFTGLPILTSDPLSGVGYGVRVIYYKNGSKEDPFFEYTPYRYRIFTQYFNTTKNAPNHQISLDAPYAFNSKFRIRADLIYTRNPNLLYFGFGEETLQPLSYRERNELGQPIVRNATYANYENALSYRRAGSAGEPPIVTDRLYNKYDNEFPSLQTSVERGFFGGRMSLVGGVRLSKQIIRTFDGSLVKARDSFFGNTDFSPINVDIPTPNGETKVVEDSKAGKIIGLDGGYINNLRAGIVYDTRDYEPNPNSGLFMEFTHEKSMKTIGSNYEYNKNHASLRFFYSPFPKVFEQLVFAGRFSFIETNGSAPFFEYINFWGTEREQSGLGGRNNLRGFKQDRFTGPAMGYANLELRWKFGSTDIGDQHFDFQIVPFYDMGRVWDETRLFNLLGYKHSYGVGLRVPWNQSTIIYVDYAISKEDRQMFINFNHIF